MTKWRSLALLGEADLLTGQMFCPRSPPDSLAAFAGVAVPEDKWIVEGLCAYVPQVRKNPNFASLSTRTFNLFFSFALWQAAWLRNASIKGE